MQAASTSAIDTTVFTRTESAIHDLNNTSVDIRADETVRDMQNLTDEIRQSVSEQQSLNRSIDAMDVGQNRTDYQQLNQIVSETEQQIQNNVVAQQEFGNEIGNSTDLAGKLKGALVAVGAGIGVKALFDFSNDFTVASNMLQAQTGATAEEMAVLSDNMKNIYGNNFGESFQDIANSMAQIKQLTGQTGSALEVTTQAALLMRDTFGFEVNESIRATDMMMKQFGITSESAYNLIAQGAQHGLDKNGDLLDTINEYSVHFKAMGMNADQMFNMLVNGVEAGAFSVDKLGDAIKEFGIRSTDCSDASVEAFEMLGLNAGDMIGRFKAGGDIAREAFDTVTNALGNMKNPVDQNIAAVALFGTMAEDLGVNGVLAMQNLEGAISSTKNTLEEINAIRYNDLGSALTALGRSVGVELLEPIGQFVNLFIGILEMCSPYISTFASILIPMIGQAIMNVFNIAFRFANFVISNWGMIAPVIGGIIAILAVYVAYMGVVNAIEAIGKGLKLASAVAEGVRAAAIWATTSATWAAVKEQKNLNAAMYANPIVWVIGIIIALISIIYVVIGAINKFAGTSISATGVIVGVFATAAAAIGNAIIGLVNFVIGIGVELYNLIASFANFFANVFNNPVGAIVHLFFDLFDTICGIVESAAGIIDKLLGSDISGSISGFRNNVQNFVDDLVGEQTVVVEKIKQEEVLIKTRWSYKDSYNAGYKLGKDIEESIPSLDDLLKVPELPEIPKTHEEPPMSEPDIETPQIYTPNLEKKVSKSAKEKVPKNIKETADNTKEIKESLNITSEDLKYMRDIAEQEIVNRFTTAEIKVEMINNNTINQEMDLDGITNHFRERLEEEMYAVAEGVH